MSKEHKKERNEKQENIDNAIKEAIKKSEKKKATKKKIIFIFLIIILISMAIFSGYKIWIWLSENKENSNIEKNISDMITINESLDTVEKYDVDFNKLKQMNNDTVAWIKVDGTNIEYPVVKTTNNDFYMTHNFEKNYNSAGWAFMDCQNKFDGTDKNIIIYGHNRRDNSMFATLRNVLTKDWQEKEENFNIPFISENSKDEYRVFSVYTIEEEEYYITKYFKDDEEFNKFVQTLKSRSVKDFGVEVSGQDSILTLSTCANDNNHRIVLHAVKLGQ